MLKWMQNFGVKIVLVVKIIGEAWYDGHMMNILKINMYLLCKISRVLILGGLYWF